MPIIQDVNARQILDSRGNPTIEVEITTASGAIGRASVPSGASTGSHEAVEKRDGDKKVYNGKGVMSGVHLINTTLRKELIGAPATEQRLLDMMLQTMDGTPNKSNFGANVTLAISLATAHAAAAHYKIPLYQYLGGIQALNLPTPMMNVINGGAHADNPIDIQEFMIVPNESMEFEEKIQCGAEVFHALKNILKKKGLSTNVGDEGGFAPELKSSREALDCIAQAVETAGYKLGEDVRFALDVAATELYDAKAKKYTLKGENLTTDSQGLIKFYEKLAKSYPISSIEDGLAEDDWKGWTALTQTLGDHMFIVGDDLFVTNVERLFEGTQKEAANAILIKPNQIGTLTETIMTIQVAHKFDFATIMSHRSGETEDTSIADIAVAMGCPYIKTGSLSRTDRVAKYNQLLRIDDRLNWKAIQQSAEDETFEF